MSRKTLLILLGTIFVSTAYAKWQWKDVGGPLSDDADTVLLLDFNADVGSSVEDSSINPINGVSQGSPLDEAIPGIDPAYQLAKKFSSASQFIDFGAIQGTKLDFEGQTALSVEAVVHLTASAQTQHVIFDNGQVQLLIIGNRPAGFVRRDGGLLGVTAESSLALNSTFRLGLIYSQNHLALTVDDVSVASVEVGGPIATLPSATTKALVGGNSFGNYLPGYIDNLRVSSIARGDAVPPQIDSISPAPGSVVSETKPAINIAYSDVGVGIDASKTEIFLNGVKQNGLTITASTISGTMDDVLHSDMVNTVRVVIYDLQGNHYEESYELKLASIDSGSEYAVDADTLFLFHMNGYEKGALLDETSKGNHAFFSGSLGHEPSIVDGVFGNGRLFDSLSRFTGPSIKLPGREFTFESWLMPTADGSQGILIDTKQIAVTRVDQGRIRVVISTYGEAYTFESGSDLAPINELHHIAVAWNGNQTSNNLKFYQDGVLVQTFTAPSNCDFSELPALSDIAFGYQGILDEVRLSSVERTSFNVVNSTNPGIAFNTLKNKWHVNIDHPVVDIDISSVVTINPSNIHLILNDQDQSSSAGLTITATKVSGTMDAAAVAGLNEIELRYVDDQGNSKSKKQYFFYLKDGGGTEYTATSDTVILAHLNDAAATTIVDSSNNSYTMSAGSFITTVPGVVSSGRSDGSISAASLSSNGRSFTLEGYFKKNIVIQEKSEFKEEKEQLDFEQTINLFTLNNVANSVALNVRLGVDTGNIEVAGSLNNTLINQTINGAVPADGSYHHVALLHDGSRSYSQLLLIVDGQLKMAEDFDCHCDLGNALTLNVGSGQVPGTTVSYDEIRFSKEAIYQLNYTMGGGSEFVSVAPAPNSSVNSATVEVSYEMTHPKGISSNGTYLQLNGVTQTQLTLVQTGTSAVLSGSVSTVAVGPNQISIHARSTDGKEQILSYEINRSEAGQPVEYTPDANTLALYHMNDQSGTFLADATSNGNDYGPMTINFNLPGVFTTSAIQLPNSSSPSIIIPQLNGLSSYTFETWFKVSGFPSIFDLFNAGNRNLRLDPLNQRFTFPNSAFPVIDVFNAFPNDGNFHHVALTVDNQGASSNVKIYIDGQIVGSASANASSLNITGDTFRFANNSDSNMTFDELRLSNVARVIFNSSQSKKHK